MAISRRATWPSWRRLPGRERLHSSRVFQGQADRPGHLCELRRSGAAWHPRHRGVLACGGGATGRLRSRHRRVPPSVEPTRQCSIALIRKVILTSANGADVDPYPLVEWRQRRADNHYNDVFDEAGNVKFPPQHNWFRRAVYRKEAAKMQTEITAYNNATCLWGKQRAADGDMGTQLFELLHRCLRANPADRLTAEDALDNPFRR